ncbi:hypothetical protein [Streptomyces sp. NPDC020298]|uniref:tetratricopeptide repeat protein n=1 Tax=unclassified Streptomyces TaxID=2593676 RepID=UPI0033C69F84
MSAAPGAGPASPAAPTPAPAPFVPAPASAPAPGPAPAPPPLPVRPAYTRTDPRGVLPRRTGLPGLQANRLTPFWRPLIDLCPSPHSPLRLRAIPLVAARLAEPPGAHRPARFSRIGVPGQRHQVLRHAGLDAYDCRTPAGLAPHLRTPHWQNLVDMADAFPDLAAPTRALLLFHLAQLTYCHYAIGLAGAVRPTGDPGHDRYVYEVARIHARTPGHLDSALSLFGELSTVTPDPALALAACFQGIGHSLRGGDGARAETYLTRGRALAAGFRQDTWDAHLGLSRFHRAAALLHPEDPHHLARAQAHHTALVPSGPGQDEATALLVAENARYLLELRIRSTPTSAPALADELLVLDPNCVEALLTAGDAHARAGDPHRAAHLYTRAGQLGTGAGAMGWYRAAQCHLLLDGTADAAHAMGRCLELDATAREPRAYLAGLTGG